MTSSSLKQFKDHYKSFENDRLINFAIRESWQLEEDAANALVDVLKERGSSSEIINIIYKQRKSLTENDVFRLANDYSYVPCPICGCKSRLNAAIFRKTIGAVVFTIKESYKVIACKSCMEKELNKINRQSLIFGWWSAFGIFKTPLAIHNNKNTYKKLENNFYDFSKTYIDYIKGNIGFVIYSIEKSKNN